MITDTNFLLLILVLFGIMEEAVSFFPSMIYRSTSTSTLVAASRNNDYHDRAFLNSSTKIPGPIMATTSPANTAHIAPTSNSRSSSIWHVWKVADHLEHSIIDNNNDDNDNDNDNNTNYLYPASKKLIRSVISILRTLGKQHNGKKDWQGILNKSTLLHEIEESIFAIHFLERELFLSSSSPLKTTTAKKSQEEIIIVDMCSGKGVFSLLCSYIFRRQKRIISNDELYDDSGGGGDYNIRKIIMLDNNPDLNWDHVGATNQFAIKDNRPIVECWSRCNLHQIDIIVDRLSQEVQVEKPQLKEEEKSSSFSSSLSATSNNNNTPVLAVVGIHLCKTLSPTCIGIVNALGPTICPLLVLAPCCLPRSVIRQSKSKVKVLPNKRNSPNGGGCVIEVRRYETPEERGSRKIATIRRDAAMVRGQGRREGKTETRPMTRGDQAVAILSCDDASDRSNYSDRVNNSMICWKCGEFGHVKTDCTSKQLTGKPQLILPPIIALEISDIFLKREQPFLAYCNLLKTSIQRSNVLVGKTDLNNKHDAYGNKSKNHNRRKNKNQTNNWNSERKLVYIVARA